LPGQSKAGFDEARRIVELILVDEELCRLAKAVEEIFREVSQRPRKRYAVPTAADCAMVAIYLMALQQNPKKPESKAVGSGEAFRRELEAERAEIAAMVSLAHSPQTRWVKEDWLREQQELLDRIDQTLQNIEWMRPRLVPQDAYRDDIRQIAACAQQAWAETNNGRAPKSRNPDDPLCQFTVAALRLIKHDRVAWTVSAVLYNKRRK